MRLIENGWVWMSWKYKGYVTCCVDIKGGKITKTPPILNKFIGQPVKNLYTWVNGRDLIWIEYKEVL